MKKKKRCCMSCLLTAIIMPIVMFGIVFGGSWIAFDKLAKPKIGVGFIDSLGLVGGLYGAKERKIVTNPYDAEADLTSFMSEVKKGLFISEDTAITVKEIIEGTLGTSASTEGKSIATANNNEEFIPYYEANTSNGEGVFADKTNNTGNSSLDTFLSKINFDFSKLSTYDGSPYLLELTDKQVAAFLNEAIKTAGSSISQIKSLGESLGVDLTEVLSIAQVVIYNENATSADATLSLTIRANTSAIIKAFMKKSGLEKISFLSGLLPKTMYLTATVYPESEDKAAVLKINNYNDKKIANMNTLLDTVLASSGGSAGFYNQINGAVVNIFGKLKNYLPISFVDSSVEAKPIQALLKIMKISDNVSEAQFLTMIKNLKFVDEDSLITNPFDQAIEKENFRKLMVSEYGLDDEKSQTLDIINNATAITDMVDMKKLRYDAQYAEHKVRVDDKMLAAIMADFLAKNDGLKALNIKLTQIEVDKVSDEKGGYITTLSTLIEADLYDMIMTKAQSMPSIAKNLVKAFFDNGKKDGAGNILPQKLYIDASTILGGDDLYTTQIKINGLDKEGTEALLNTIRQITNSFLSDAEVTALLEIDKLSAKIGEAIKSAIIKVEGEDGLRQALNYEQNTVLLPSIFETIKGIAKLTQTAVQVQEVLRDISIVGAKIGNVSETKFNDFLNELNTDYFLQESIHLTADNFETNLKNLSGSINSTSFKIRPTATGDENAILSTKRPLEDLYIDDLRVTLEESALAYYMSKKDISVSTSTQINKVETLSVEIVRQDVLGVSHDFMKFVMKITMTNASGGQYNNITPENVYVTALCNMTEKQEVEGVLQNTYTTTVQINDMTDAVMTNFFDIVNTFQKVAEPDKITAKSFEDKISESIKNVMKGVDGGGTIELNFEGKSPSNTNEGRVVMPSIFGVIHKQLFKNSVVADTPSVENFMLALQGLNEISDYETGGSKIINEVDATLVNDPSISNRVVTDQYLGKKIAEKLKNSTFASENIDGVTLMQCILYSNNSDEKMQRVRDTFGGMFTGVFGAKDAIMITAGIGIQGFITGESNAKELLPSSIYATIVIEKGSTDKNSKLAIVNSLKDDLQIALQQTINAVSAQSGAGHKQISLASILNSVYDEAMGLSLTIPIVGTTTIQTMFDTIPIGACAVTEVGLGKMTLTI